MPTLESYNGYYLWHYVPSLIAAIIFEVLFVLATLFHAYKIARTKTWFCIVFVIGGILEIIGYAGRAIARDRTGQVGPYVMQSLTILIAPALFAASVYMTLGRIIRSVHGESLSVIRINWLTRIFVAGDCFSFLVQASGGGLMVKDGSQKMGQNLIVAGLVIQIVLFAIFWVTAIVFHSRLAKNPTQASLAGHSPWKSGLWMLYIVSACIMVRSVFRLIEYVLGGDGYPLRHEWTLYVFDATLMFFVMVAFGFRFPSAFQIRKGGSQSASDAENYDLAVESEQHQPGSMRKTMR
ncbi:RTM1 [Colletotrichum scovillei]|uniref:RTA1 like protein n=1 Tax=Colletotrichum scovillei TaxID=1209932 RepID=A0A9P7UHL0_9PEZI|nr:RTM1 [Colletotrichum scovillei]KAF4775715.1 RTM1 [Colletotrichum scovillei]KAG7053617.1 RTA1 like protein [Colletotrichum scovillei]KAG7071914.1 RTA1 like protein [Colletotrichum scovillei]KAG7080161.1 RTA1 like protein [Colletotrichum scovillei]